MIAAAPVLLHPPARLGVIGGGQLGRMFLQAAQRMGYRPGVLCQSEDDPAAQVADWVVLGKSNDSSAVKAFCQQAEAITVEFENVSAPALRWLARHRPVRPAWNAVWISQNRLREKRFLARHGFPLAPWRPVRSAEELAAAVAEQGTPFILKTAASGYDGKGQVRVDRPADAESAWQRLRKVPCVAESVVPFAAEVSVVVARGADGQADAFPVCWNQHARHILDVTVAPAPIGPIASLEARTLALGVAQAFDYVGVMAVEFFLTAEGHLLINEIAPRPHNSGHLTIEASVCSQFEQQVRALCGLPLGEAKLVSPAAMVNLLGDLWQSGEPQWESALALDPGVRLHLYGKSQPAPGRKMGHITVLDADIEEALLRAQAARRALQEK